MPLIPGNNDPQNVGRLTIAELKAEAARLANNHGMTGMEYTAAVMKRLAELVK